jgi:hypothetical protein
MINALGRRRCRGRPQSSRSPPRCTRPRKPMAEWCRRVPRGRDRGCDRAEGRGEAGAEPMSTVIHPRTFTLRSMAMWFVTFRSHDDAVPRYGERRRISTECRRDFRADEALSVRFAQPALTSHQSDEGFVLAGWRDCLSRHMARTRSELRTIQIGSSRIDRTRGLEPHRINLVISAIATARIPLVSG